MKRGMLILYDREGRATRREVEYRGDFPVLKPDESRMARRILSIDERGVERILKDVHGGAAPPRRLQ